MDPNGSTSTTTVELLRRWHTGDEDALREILDRNLSWIHRTVRSRIGPLLRARAESGDLVQEVVLEFLRYGPRFIVADRSHLRALLARISENVIRGEHDRFAARCRSMLRERPLPRDSVLDLTLSGGSTHAPERQAERREREALVRLVLSLVDPEDRALVLERSWEGLSFEDMGRSRGLSTDAARMRFHRALARLARWMRIAEQGRLGESLDIPPPAPEEASGGSGSEPRAGRDGSERDEREGTAREDPT